MAGDESEVSVHDDLMRFKPDGMSPNGWAVLAGVSRTVWADMKRHDNPSRRTLEKLLAVAGSSLAEFEALRIGDTATESKARDLVGAVGDHRAHNWRGAPPPPIPVFWSASSYVRRKEGAIECLIIDRSQRISSVARPTSLATDQTVFAITMLDDKMWPRFRPGRQIIVSLLAPVATGDDVLVTIGHSNDGRALGVIGELVRRSGRAVELRQFNPAKSISFDVGDVESIARIVGESY